MKLKKKPHILIIGSGVLGAYLSKSLIGKKYNIIVTTRRIKKNFLNYKKLKIDKKVKFQKLNILNKKEIRKVINKYIQFAFIILRVKVRYIKVINFQNTQQIQIILV